jgi:hypothetical protein
MTNRWTQTEEQIEKNRKANQENHLESPDMSDEMFSLQMHM